MTAAPCRTCHSTYHTNRKLGLEQRTTTQVPRILDAGERTPSMSVKRGMFQVSEQKQLWLTGGDPVRRHLQAVEQTTLVAACLLGHEFCNLRIMSLGSHPLRLAPTSGAHRSCASYQVRRHLTQRRAHAPDDVRHQRLPPYSCIRATKQGALAPSTAQLRRTFAIRCTTDSGPGTPLPSQGNSSTAPIANQILRVLSKCKCPHVSAERQT